MAEIEEPSEPDSVDQRNRPRVEIVGDPTAITTRLQEQLAGSIIGDSALREIRAKLGPSDALAKRIGESMKALDVGGKVRSDALAASMQSLRAVAIPARIDLSEQITARAKPLAFQIPEPVRSVVDVRLEAVADRLDTMADALNRLIDVAEVQRDATLAAQAADDNRHDDSERRDDERAGRADNRASWNIAIAGATLLLVLAIEIFR